SQAAEGPAVLHRKHRAPPRSPPEPAHPQLQPPARARRESGVPRRADTDDVGRHPHDAAQALRRAAWSDGELLGGARLTPTVAGGRLTPATRTRAARRR